MSKLIVQPVLSIIIPVYNTEHYLKECLNSVVNQTFQDIEIIIVNDCSPDNSEEIILQYQHSDSRIKYIKHESNKGTYHTRETGAYHASGSYLLYIDSDDTIDLQLCEQIYPLTLSSPDCITYNIIIDYKTHFKESKWVNRNLQNYTKEKEFFYKLCSGEIHPGALVQKITKRDLALQVYKEINLQERLITAEDYLYNIWYSYHCTIVKHINFDGYFYNCTNTNSATGCTFDLKRALNYLDQLSIVIHKFQELCSLKNLPFSTIDNIQIDMLVFYIRLSFHLNISYKNILIPKITASFSPQIITNSLFNLLNDTQHNKWYQFGQLSRKQKIKNILVISLKKLHLYSPIKSLYHILRDKHA